jgi:hypothetical protein
VRALIVAIFITAIAAPALAQPERLPAQSRSEQQIQDINRSLAVQQRELRQEQQTQFEINQLRNQFQQQQSQPIRPGCAIGTIC